MHFFKNLNISRWQKVTACVIFVFLSTFLILYTELQSLAQQREPVIVKAIAYLHPITAKKKQPAPLVIEVKKPERVIARATYPYTKSNDTNNGRNKGADYQVDLVLETPGLEKNACLGYSVKISQAIDNRDVHQFDVRVEFYLSDGYVIAASREKVTLNKENQTVEFSSF